MVTAEVIMFGVRGGLQLYGAMRKAYVDGTRARALVLPLPRSPGVDWTTAATWFNGEGSHNKDEYDRVGALMAMDDWDDAQKQELLELYQVLFLKDNPGAGQGEISGMEIDSLLRIRQWENGHGPDPSPLQTIAGTLVNVAVDYFIEMPGAISEDRPQGRALKAFLETIDNTDFSTTATHEIAPKLLVAVLDSVSKNPDLVAGGERARELIANVTAALATSVQENVVDASSDEREKAGVWVQLVARALIEGGAGTVLANPARFLNVSPDQAALVTRVGKAISDLVVGDDAVTFRPLLSADGLTVIAKAALAAVADNPGILKIGDKGLRTILVAVAGDLSKLPGTFSPDMLPEVARIVIEKTAENMDLVWGPAFSAAPRHLLVTATKTFLTEFAKTGKPGGWKPTFTEGQVLTALEAVLDEVVDNPQWLLTRAGETNPILGQAVAGIVESLKKIDGNRISADTGIAVLNAAIEAVAIRVSFLDTLPPAAGAEARLAITAAIDAVFDTVFADGVDADKQFRLARNSTVLAIVEVGLDELAERGADEAHIGALRATVVAELNGTAPFDIEKFTEDLRVRLDAA